MTVNEASVEKYVQGIVTINSTLGRLDVLRLHLTENNDKFSIDVVEAIMEELSKICGVDYKFIDLSNVKIKQEEKNVKTVKEINYIKPIIDNKQSKNHADFLNVNSKEQTIIEVIQDDNYIYPEELEENNIAKATLETEKAKQDLTKKKKANKVINKSAGVEADKNGNLTYKFVNSNTLDFMTYNRDTKNLTMCFLQNGRTYLYKTVPMYIFDNLHITDESGASAGSYFQQNVVKKWGKGKYKEITDTQLIEQTKGT